MFAENEDNSPWEPLHVERGFDIGTSTVTVKSEATLSGHSVPGGRFSGIFALDIYNGQNRLLNLSSLHSSNRLHRRHNISAARAKWFADNGMTKTM